ncbi:MAG TPA: AMP-binding protein [Cyclobacteriaceae bacterium]|nr:AMP-binding protein [Cyclobacteriaceae bacterium]
MEASTPLLQFLKWEKETPDSVMLRQPFSGEWRNWTYQQAGEEIRKIASGLKGLNLPPRSNIALLSKNCAQWIMADLAIMMAGHISVPLYATLTAPSIKQILEHSEAKAIFVGKLDKYEEQKEGIPASVQKIGMELYGIHESISIEKMIATEKPLTESAAWDRDEVLTIMYTSGTTGKPKGVMHSAGNFDAIVQTGIIDLELPMHPRLFSYLPISHIAERAGIEMIGIYRGAIFSFAESLDTFPKNLAETQPNLFFAVPRIWAKFREKISEKLPPKKLNTLLSIPIINNIIRKSIKKKLGLAEATHIYSGAAPISVDLLEWFDKIGVTIYQAIGMTEDCIYSHFNRRTANRFGTVGKALTGVKVKIADDGEFRLKSAGVMKGYYKEPELTAATFDEEGYLKTGDKAEYDKDGFLSIVGRVKDQFKTDKGKYVSPAPIEMLLLANQDIEQACVVGMGIPQPIALVVLSASGKAKAKDELIASLSASLREVNPALESYEKLEKVVVMKGDWTVENGLITPTLKVKRNEVEKIHLPKYPTWYHTQPGVVVWE